jgi:hypothetical protein
MIFSTFRLGRIASGYFDNLGKASQLSNLNRKFIEDQQLKQESKCAYLGAGV